MLLLGETQPLAMVCIRPRGSVYETENGFNPKSSPLLSFSPTKYCLLLFLDSLFRPSSFRLLSFQQKEGRMGSACYSVAFWGGIKKYSNTLIMIISK